MWKQLLIVLLLLSGCEKIEVYKTSKDQKSVVFKKGEVQCVECTMPLQTKLYSAQAIMKNERVYFFDDSGCLAKWLQKGNKPVKIWVFANDTRRYIDAKKAWYRLGEETLMHYGFGAYEKKVPGGIGFEKFLQKIYCGEDLTNPALRKKILGVNGD